MSRNVWIDDEDNVHLDFSNIEEETSIELMLGNRTYFASCVDFGDCHIVLKTTKEPE